MSGAYMPPHLRRKSSANPEDAKPDNQREQWYTLDDIKQHYWPESFESSRGDGSTTLHASQNRPSLTFVLLFPGANPIWESANIIFVKSNLHLLPLTNPVPTTINAVTRKPSVGGEEQGREQQEQSQAETLERIKTPERMPTLERVKTPERTQNRGQEARELANIRGQADPSPKSESREIAEHEPIAVFAGGRRGQNQFQFVGWHKVEKVQLLPPKSEELVKMLHQKWSRTDKYGNVKTLDRDAAAWKQSLGYTWAVIKFAKDQQANKNMVPPAIERSAKPLETRSVNEMLQQLRMRDDAKTGGDGTKSPEIENLQQDGEDQG